MQQNTAKPLPLRSGFTLVELLVTIAIVITFTAVLLPVFNNFGRRNDLLQGAQFVQAQIQQTKAYALAPRSQGGSSIYRYEFRGPVRTYPTPRCAADPGRYAIFEWTTTDRDTLPVGSDPSKDITPVVCDLLPSGLVFVSPGNDQRVYFDTPQGTAHFPGTQTTFTLRNPRLPSNNANCINIIVTLATGQVTIGSLRSCT